MNKIIDSVLIGHSTGETECINTVLLLSSSMPLLTARTKKGKGFVMIIYLLAKPTVGG